MRDIHMIIEILYRASTNSMCGFYIFPGAWAVFVDVSSHLWEKFCPLNSWHVRLGILGDFPPPPPPPPPRIKSRIPPPTTTTTTRTRRGDGDGGGGGEKGWPFWLFLGLWISRDQKKKKTTKKNSQKWRRERIRRSCVRACLPLLCHFGCSSSLAALIASPSPH